MSSYCKKLQEIFSKSLVIQSTFSGYDEHGTLMAGLAAAEANNAICGVGVAFNATISGILAPMNSLDIVRFP